MSADASKIDADALIKRIVALRGDLFGEFKMVAETIPDTQLLMFEAAGYMHSYETLTAPDQELSAPMRELIAVCQLAAQHDGRFAANHVRRLYRLGITDAVMFEAAEAISPVVGWSVLSHVAQAIMTANDPAYPEGKMPPDGPPKECKPFPEMDLGRDVVATPAQESIADSPEFKYIAKIDPELVKRTAAFADHCLLAPSRPGKLLGPGVRELVAAAALCVRGEAELASRHIKRAYVYGLTRRQVLEAISCICPMTGAVSIQVGARAMQLADEGG